MTALGIADMHGKEAAGWPQLVLAALAAYVVYFAVRFWLFGYNLGFWL